MFNKLDLAQFKGLKNVESTSFLLFGEIDTDVAAAVAEWILNCNAMDEPPNVLNLFINSSGGDLMACWAIIDFINGSDIPVRTIGVGQVASAGLFILMSGLPGMRVLSENCSVMSHQYAWGSQGKHHELMAQVKEYNMTHERLIKHFVKTCKLSEADIMQYLMPAHDVYLSPEEAKSLGLCDIVKTLK